MTRHSLAGQPGPSYKRKSEKGLARETIHDMMYGCMCMYINLTMMSMWSLLRRLQFVQLSFPAPPLTLDNVLNVVKNVQDWRPLCDAMLIMPELDETQRQHYSDEDCLKDVVERFLRGRSLQYEKPSWRAVIWCLYVAKEIQLAKQIRSYAEAVQGIVITM